MTCLIENEVVALVPVTQADAMDWRSCWQDKATQRGFNFIPPDDDDWGSSLDVERFPFWVVMVEKRTGAKVGMLRLSPEQEQPDLAIWVYPAYRGKGLGSSAFALALAYLFAHGYDMIYAGCYAYNTPSMRILKKNGFVRWNDGDMVDTSVFDGSQITMLGFCRARD